MAVEAAEGNVVEPRSLLGDWPEGRFSWTRGIPDSIFAVGFREGEATAEHRSCTLDVLLPGPNLGSAGGPTLVHTGSLMTPIYHGMCHVAG